MSKKPKGMHDQCMCGKWLTLWEVDKHYNAYKTAYCDECFTKRNIEDDENQDQNLTEGISGMEGRWDIE